MIIGVSHLCFNAHNIKKSIQFFTGLGLSHKFIQQTVENNTDKNPFLSKDFYQYHDIALMVDKGGFCIEPIFYNEKFNGNNEQQYCLFNKYFNVLGEHSIDDTIINSTFKSFFKSSLSKITNDDNVQIFGTSDNQDIQLPNRVIFIPAEDHKAETEFLEIFLKLSSIEKINNANHLRFNSFIKSWEADFIVFQDKRGGTSPKLDQNGFSCIAFLVSDIHSEVDNLTRNNINVVTNVFSLTINEKILDVALFKTPNNNIIELIEVKNG